MTAPNPVGERLVDLAGALYDAGYTEAQIARVMGEFLRLLGKPEGEPPRKRTDDLLRAWFERQGL